MVVRLLNNNGVILCFGRDLYVIGEGESGVAPEAVGDARAPKVVANPRSHLPTKHKHTHLTAERR